MKHLRPVFVFAVIALSLAALWITDHMMGIHAPRRAQAAVSDQGGILADICGGDDEEDGGGCEDVIKSEDGYVPIPWRFDVIQRVKNEQGKATSKTVTRWGWIKVPVAQLGQCYYILVLVWFAFTGVPRRASRRWHLLPMALSILAVFATCYYIFVMAFRLEQWCALCLLLHLADFLMCALIVALWPWAKELKQTKKEEHKGRPTDAVPPPASLVNRHIYATLAVAAALISMSFLHRYDQLITEQAKKTADGVKKQYTDIKTNTAFLVNAYQGTPRANISIRETASTVGDASAAHELVIFSDLQCPRCKTFETWFKDQVLGAWGGRLKITFRHFPLCTACNPSQKKNEHRPLGLHPRACDAAYATEAARRIGGPASFWKMHDLILERQASMKSGDFSFEPLAAQLGLGAERFRAEFAGSAVRQAVAQDVQAGIKLKLRGTPTAFLNGRQLLPIQRGSRAFWLHLAATARQNGSSRENMSVQLGS